MIKLIALTLFPLSVFAVDIDGMIPIDRESEKTALAEAAKHDPLGNAKPTKTPPDETFEGKKYKAIQINGGLQLHPSCELEASRMGMDRENFKKTMDELMRTMVDRMNRCMREYPEMSGWIRESISQFRRQVIKCEPPSGKKGLVAPQPDIGTYDAYNEGSSITVSSNFVDRVVGNQGSGGALEASISTMFHELLHSTKCNNRHDHNSIERIPASVSNSKACDDNASMDRVSVVESLCMGTNLNSSTAPATEVLSNRLAMCGKDRGCRDLFTARGSDIGFWQKLMGTSYPTSELSDDQATRLCQRIKDDGQCLHIRKTQGKVMTKSNPQIKAVVKRMKERIDQLTPGLTNQLPTEVLKLYPDLDAKFTSLKGSPCFKRHFYIPDSKPNEINALRSSAMTTNKEIFGQVSQAFGNHIDNIFKDYNQFIKRFKPDEECGKTEKELGQVLKDFAEKASEDPNLWTLKELETQLEYGNYWEKASNLDPNTGIVKLIGKDLMQDYARTMDRFHHNSPKFDCVAAGLAPFRAMEAATKKPDACE